MLMLASRGGSIKCSFYLIFGSAQPKSSSSLASLQSCDYLFLVPKKPSYSNFASSLPVQLNPSPAQVWHPCRLSCDYLFLVPKKPSTSNFASSLSVQLNPSPAQVWHPCLSVTFLLFIMAKHKSPAKTLAYVGSRARGCNRRRKKWTAKRRVVPKTRPMASAPAPGSPVWASVS